MNWVAGAAEQTQSISLQDKVLKAQLNTLTHQPLRYSTLEPDLKNCRL